MSLGQRLGYIFGPGTEIHCARKKAFFFVFVSLYLQLLIQFINICKQLLINKRIMSYNYLEKFVNHLQSQGRYTFTFEELQQSFEKGKSAIHMTLNRFREKGRIIRIRNGFYVVVPPEYSAQGILPVPLFIHDLMAFLGKPYYIGLINAAALHGAGHQQPQSWSVITIKPPVRPMKPKGLSIFFITKKNMPGGIIDKKTDTGMIHLSNPALTAIDLIQFERQSGGFRRIIEILEELSELITEYDVRDIILQNKIASSVLQRFGFICEYFLDRSDLTNTIHSVLNSTVYPVPLSPGNKSRAGTINNRWKIIKNVE